MDSLTIRNADRSLQTGSLLDTKSLRVDPGPSAPASETSGASFAETLKTAVDQVNQLQKSSDKAMQDLATGRTDNVADVMIAAEKADVALRVMVQVRNKIVDAYTEIMRMQV